MSNLIFNIKSGLFYKDLVNTVKNRKANLSYMLALS